jgi:ankyrin repeat protein
MTPAHTDMSRDNRISDAEAREMGLQVLKELQKGKAGVPAAIALVEKGASVHETNEAGHTALVLAAARNYQPLAQVLLDRGADPNFQRDGGDTPLISAVKHCYVAVAKMLVMRGADVTLVNGQGQTAAVCALERKNHRNARLLDTWAAAAADRKVLHAWIDSGLPTQADVALKKPLQLKAAASAPENPLIKQPLRFKPREGN